MWKNIVERARSKTTIWRMRIECWVTKATETHSVYVILTAFPPEKWLHKRGLELRYTYSAHTHVMLRTLHDVRTKQHAE